MNPIPAPMPIRVGRVALLLLVATYAALVLAWPFLAPDPRRVGANPMFALLTGGPFLVVGCLVLLRAGWHRIGWLLLGAGLALTVALAALPGLPVEYDNAWRDQTVWTIVFAFLAWITLVFPSGRSDAWSGTARVVALWAVRSLPALMLLAALALLVALVSGEETYVGTLASPAAVLSDASVNAAALALVGGAVSLLLRFRRSTGELRAQLKWVVTALTSMAVIVVLVLAGIAIEGDDESMFWLYFPLMVTYAAVPAAIAVAILRYRLYDIDRIVSRTITYGLLTAGLAAIYFGLVVALQALLRPLTGSDDSAIVVTTLLVAGLFLPARRRVQAAVDRRFNRRMYDAARTIDAFSARLRQPVDLDTLRSELLAVVDETMQPARASVWLRRPEAKK